jgi:cell division protein FtsN
MAQRRRTSRKQQEDYPGWMWMLFGLAIGLSVAFAIYMKDQRAASANMPVAREPASMTEPLAPEPAPLQAEPEEEQEPRFSFYDMLPSFEVIIPEQEPDVRREKSLETVQQPGVYILQAGSFTLVADADRRRAELGLLGIESWVQRVTIDDRTYYRVRIGPVDDLDRLNLIRAQLRQANIDALRIRVGD